MNSDLSKGLYQEMNSSCLLWGKISTDFFKLRTCLPVYGGADRTIAARSRQRLHFLSLKLKYFSLYFLYCFLSFFLILFTVHVAFACQWASSSRNHRHPLQMGWSVLPLPVIIQGSSKLLCWFLKRSLSPIALSKLLMSPRSAVNFADLWN